jgi:hypothetical protein
MSRSDAVLAETERIVARITDQYFAPHLSREEMHALVRAHESDPLRAVGDACRAELEAMRSQFQSPART